MIHPLLNVHKPLCIVFMALLIVFMALLILSWALVMLSQALLIVSGALLRAYRFLWGVLTAETWESRVLLRCGTRGAPSCTYI